MATAVIICNGDFPRTEYPRYLIRTADYIICCDNAAASFIRHSAGIFGETRRPDIIIGDMDSLPARFQRENADILVKVTEQETNDMSKAFHYAISHYKDLERIRFLAATGRREAHTLGNLSLLMEFAKELNGTAEHRTYDIPENPYQGKDILSIEAVSDYSTAFPVTGSCTLHVGEGRQVSIFSPDNSLRITSEGLAWQTSGVVFDNWWKASLNRATSDIVTLKFSHQSAALIILD